MERKENHPLTLGSPLNGKNTQGIAQYLLELINEQSVQHFHAICIGYQIKVGLHLTDNTKTRVKDWIYHNDILLLGINAL